MMINLIAFILSFAASLGAHIAFLILLKLLTGSSAADAEAVYGERAWILLLSLAAPLISYAFWRTLGRKKDLYVYIVHGILCFCGAAALVFLSGFYTRG